MVCLDTGLMGVDLEAFALKREVFQSEPDRLKRVGRSLLVILYQPALRNTFS
jgi:hypothetical protein